MNGNRERARKDAGIYAITVLQIRFCVGVGFLSPPLAIPPLALRCFPSRTSANIFTSWCCFGKGDCGWMGGGGRG